MEFTFTFIKLFFYGLNLAAPLLISLIILITVFGQLVGKREGWTQFDALYWAFITATTVGYGDIRPITPASKVLSIFIALIGMIFTGIMVALAIHAATISFSSLHGVTSVKDNIEQLK